MPCVSLVRPLLFVTALAGLLAGCASHAALSDHDCMTRVMYFESNRSSEDGMVAVGTTVMNRLADPRYPKTVCGVIGQRNQYAPGVLDKPMIPREEAYIGRVADAVLGGERHPEVGGAKFFHTAGLTFPYTNMHYVAVAGGNAFYEKTDDPLTTPNGFSHSYAAPYSGVRVATGGPDHRDRAPLHPPRPPHRPVPPKAADDAWPR